MGGLSMNEMRDSGGKGVFRGKGGGGAAKEAHKVHTSTPNRPPPPGRVHTDTLDTYHHHQVEAANQVSVLLPVVQHVLGARRRGAARRAGVGTCR